MADAASQFSASTPPDSMILALLLRQLDIIDLKRLSAARQQFEESHRGSQTSRSMSGSGSGSGRFRFATDQALKEENLTKNRYSNIVSCESKSSFREHIKADVRGIGVDGSHRSAAYHKSLSFQSLLLFSCGDLFPTM